MGRFIVGLMSLVGIVFVGWQFVAFVRASSDQVATDPIISQVSGYVGITQIMPVVFMGAIAAFGVLAFIWWLKQGQSGGEP